MPLPDHLQAVKAEFNIQLIDHCDLTKTFGLSNEDRCREVRIGAFALMKHLRVDTISAGERTLIIDTIIAEIRARLSAPEFS